MRRCDMYMNDNSTDIYRNIALFQNMKLLSCYNFVMPE